MARERVPTLVLALLLLGTGCSGQTPSARGTPSPSTSSPAAPGATRTPTQPTAGDVARPDITGPGPDGAKITMPPAGTVADGPAVVLVHGGFWVGGSPSQLDDWADTIAATGAVVFNVSYRLLGAGGGGYPETMDDVACAVRYARAEAPGLTTSDRLVIVGHSAGAHLAAVAALNGDSFGAGCDYPEAPLPDQLVGLAGVYDVREYGSLFGVFVGAPPAEAPEKWQAVNPAQLVGNRDDLQVTLIVGGDDQLVSPSQADDFAGLLPPDRVTLEVIPGARHEQLLSPEVVGVAALRLEA